MYIYEEWNKKDLLFLPKISLFYLGFLRSSDKKALQSPRKGLYDLNFLAKEVQLYFKKKMGKISLILLELLENAEGGGGWLNPYLDRVKIEV